MTIKELVELVEKDERLDMDTEIWMCVTDKRGIAPLTKDDIAVVDAYGKERNKLGKYDWLILER